MSNKTSLPASMAAITGALGVPYQLPLTSAHSSSSPSPIIVWNSSRVLKKYSRPSSSPGRGARVVAEIERIMSA
jgi:hypothetical protein